MIGWRKSMEIKIKKLCIAKKNNNTYIIFDAVTFGSP